VELQRRLEQHLAALERAAEAELASRRGGGGAPEALRLWLLSGMSQLADQAAAAAAQLQRSEAELLGLGLQPNSAARGVARNWQSVRRLQRCLLEQLAAAGPQQRRWQQEWRLRQAQQREVARESTVQVGTLAALRCAAATPALALARRAVLRLPQAPCPHPPAPNLPRRRCWRTQRCCSC
jgi:hypothetical protein